MQKVAKIGPEKEILLGIGEASEYLRVSIDTLRRWEKKNKIIALRSPGGHRYFKQKDLDNLFGRKYEREKEKGQRNVEKVVKITTEEIQHPTKPTPTQSIPKREPRVVAIPIATPIKVIQSKAQSTPTPQTAPSLSQIPQVSSPQKSILTPASIKQQAQEKPINSIPPAATLKQEVVRNNSNAWIYLAVGLVILILGFTVFAIFRSPAEVISPVPLI